MTAPASPAPTATASATAPTAPRLHLVVVPTPQPPLVDDEPVRLVLPGVPVPRPPHRPGPPPRTGGRTGRRADDFGPFPSSRSDLPDPREAGRRLLTVTVEGLAGRRPLAQLRTLTSPRLFDALERGRRPRWCAQGSAPLVLGRVHVSEPVDGVAEVCAVVRQGSRAHAVAARLEGVDGRWRCTALQIG